MKKRVLFIASIYSFFGQATTNKTSETFFFTRPLFHALFAQQYLWNDIINGDLTAGNSSSQLLYMYQKSTPFSPTAGYFLLDCQPCISIRGDGVLSPSLQIPAASQRNVRAEWLNLSTDFDGTLCLCPAQEEQGVFFEYNYNMSELFGFSLFQGWWFDFFMPFIWMKNNIHPRGQEELLAALDNPTWCGARITAKDLKKMGVPEIRFTLGTTLYNHNDFVLAYYTGLAVPTVNKYPSTYLFSPLLGVNGHIAFVNGLTMELPLWSNCSYSDIRILLNAKNDWYLAHHQTRTFDLWNKPWSRYMQYRKQGEAETISGVNLFTYDVEVHPNNMFELAAALRGRFGGFYGEIGYSLWGHGDERIEFPEKKCATRLSRLEQYGIAGDTVMTDQGPYYSSASESTISTLVNDPVDIFVTLKPRDIYLCSANGRGGIVNRANITFGYAGETDSIVALAAIGGYIEYPLNNTLLRNRGLWGKICLNF